MAELQNICGHPLSGSKPLSGFDNQRQSRKIFAATAIPDTTPGAAHRNINSNQNITIQVYLHFQKILINILFNVFPF